jgi:rare lipoprotein A
VGDRIIDLTRAAAERLDMIGAGTAQVRLETVGTVPGLRDGDLSGRFYVQVGAFGRQANAESLAARLRGRGMSVRIHYADQVGFWRVQVGPYPSLSGAGRAGDALDEQFRNNFVVSE